MSDHSVSETILNLQWFCLGSALLLVMLIGLWGPPTYLCPLYQVTSPCVSIFCLPMDCGHPDQSDLI